MKKQQSSLVRQIGCEGCKKNCEWNGRSAASDAVTTASKFGCNSSNFIVGGKA